MKIQPPPTSVGLDLQTQTPKISAKQVARGVFSTVAALATLTCLIATIIIAKRVAIDLGIEPLRFNEVTSKTIDIQLDLARTLFQIALVVAGALLGLVIAKKDEIQIVFSKPAEVVMFVAACSLLLLSMGSYCVYLSNISNFFADAVAASTKGNLPSSIPNIFNQNVNYLFSWQIVSLAFGIFNSVLTFISAHKLRE